MSCPMPEIGSCISLISKADIRYEGLLFTVDPDRCTIALARGKYWNRSNRGRIGWKLIFIGFFKKAIVWKLLFRHLVYYSSFFFLLYAQWWSDKRNTSNLIFLFRFIIAYFSTSKWSNCGSNVKKRVFWRKKRFFRCTVAKNDFWKSFPISRCQLTVRGFDWLLSLCVRACVNVAVDFNKTNCMVSLRI